MSELLQKLWDLNEKHPDYIYHVSFDHISEPYHKMDECKKRFIEIRDAAIQKAVTEINEMIEIGEENGKNTRDLLTRRKEIRSLKDLDVSDCEKIEDLKAKIPSLLKNYWGKQ